MLHAPCDQRCRVLLQVDAAEANNAWLRIIDVKFSRVASFLSYRTKMLKLELYVAQHAYYTQHNTLIKLHET